MARKELVLAVMAGFLGGALSGPLLRARSALAETTHYEKVISAEKLVLTDKDGTARVGCGVGEDGRVTIAVSDKNGKVRIGFGVLADGSPSLDFYDLNNKPRMVLGLKDESPFLVFNDNNEIHRILLRQSPKGSPHLDFNDADGKLRAVFGSMLFSTDKGPVETAESSLVLLNTKGEVLSKIPN